MLPEVLEKHPWIVVVAPNAGLALAFLLVKLRAYRRRRRGGRWVVERR